MSAPVAEDEEAAQAATKIQKTYRGKNARERANKIKHDTARRKVTEYLRKHKVNELLQHLVSLLVYLRPEDPRSFLSEELRKLARAEMTDLVVDSDLDTMFDMVDITRQGFVTGTQLKHCGANLQIEKMPKLEATARYNRQQFKEALGPGLQMKATMWAS
eukprot:TRINITY_DN14176_c0_g1_i1.p1 TRINITY_DN14176_c0_g1~~TRINITY_DN14176_c0_g1_i1.p1  ORF type:complete len:187 (+),score=62.12 TRINITY_DN14176_c0_g1_i1:83-562(+)